MKGGTQKEQIREELPARQAWDLSSGEVIQVRMRLQEIGLGLSQVGVR